MARLAKVPFFQANAEGALNMLSSRFAFPGALSHDTYSVNPRHETMIAFLRMLDERYGGVAEYLKKVVGLTDEDISVIRKNFRVPTSKS